MAEAMTMLEPFEQAWEEISDRVSKIAQRLTSKPRIVFIENKFNKKNGMISNYLKANGYDLTTVTDIGQLQLNILNGSNDCYMVDAEADTTLLKYLYTMPKSAKIIGLTKKNGKRSKHSPIFDCIIDTSDLQLNDLTSTIRACLNGTDDGRKK